jgi:hypothetical protein
LAEEVMAVGGVALLAHTLWSPEILPAASD